MKSQRVLYLTALSGTLIWAGQGLGQSTFYVSPTGNDNNDGLTPGSAWASVTKVDNSTFAPGSQILFQDGGNWYNQLIASSSGTVAAPITYGSYGAGSQPTFWGSDQIGASAFVPVSGAANTYTYNTSTPVNSFLVDHQFAHSAALVSGQTTAAGNISYVQSTPNTWYYDTTASRLYVNTGAAMTDTHSYDVATRVGLVESNSQSNVVFKNLSVKESAQYNWGYAYYAFGGSNVQFVNDTSVGAGKHAFAAINTQNFVGQNLTSSYLMPDQGIGGASAYVTYSDSRVATAGTPSSSAWINDSFNNANGPYEGFYSHGDPGTISSLLVQNMYTNSWPGIGIQSVDANEKVTILGGRIDGLGQLDLGATGALVNGLVVNGGQINVIGDNNIIENSIITGNVPSWYSGHDGSLTVNGQNNIVRFNTINLGAATAYGGAAIALEIPGTNTQIYGNIIDSPYGAYFLKGFSGNPGISASHNLYAGANNNNPYIFDSIDNITLTVSQWQAMGYEVSSIFANPEFADASNGNYTLLAGSPAIGVFNPSTGQLIGTDFYGDSRPTWTTLGAIEPAITVAGSTTVTAANDAAIGAAGAGLTLAGGSLAVTQSFTTARPLTVAGSGGTINVAQNAVLGINSSWITWAGGTLKITGAGATTIANTDGMVTVVPASTINIAAGASVAVNGTIDPFTDTFAPSNHVAIVNNGALSVNINSTIAGITGSGSLTIGNGASNNTLQFAPGSAPSTVASLNIKNGAALDLTNNALNIAYGNQASPAATIEGYLVSGYDGGGWNGLGIVTFMATSGFTLGYRDNGSGNIQISYALIGDTDLDGSIGFSDLLTLAKHFNQPGATWATGDFNYDGSTNFLDLLLLARNYGSAMSAAEINQLNGISPSFVTSLTLAQDEVSAVPEPTSLALIAVGAIGLLSRRRRQQ